MNIALVSSPAQVRYTSMYDLESKTEMVTVTRNDSYRTLHMFIYPQI